MPLEYTEQPSGYVHTPKPLPPFRKRWKLAESRLKATYDHSTNINKEQFFMKMLKEVKQLYATVNERVFERDEREDNSRNPFLMYTFITSSFFFELECNFNYYYEVHYDIGPGLFEAGITAMLNKYYGALEPVHKKKEPDLHTYFKEVEAYSGSKHFYVLTPDAL